MFSRRLTIWLSLSVYLVGGMLLPATHVHTHVAACGVDANEEHAHASTDACCGHSHACSSEEPTSHVHNSADSESQIHSLTDVFGHDHDCPLCEFQNTAAQKCAGPSLIASLETLHSLQPFVDAFATCVDISVPPLRGPPALFV